MYETNQNIGFVVEHLSRDEWNKLKKVVTGYGRLRAFSRNVGMHENTLRGVILKGRGKPETVSLIRQKLMTA